MSHAPWWIDRGVLPRSRFRWPWLRPIVPSPARRLTLSPLIPFTPATLLSNPSPLPSPLPVTSVRLSEPQDSNPLFVGFTPAPERSTTPSARRPATRVPPTGPSLAERLRTVLALPLDFLLPAADAVLDWPGPLLPYQLDGVRTLLSHPRLLLADDMGLGKTVQVAAALRILCIQRAIESALLIVPAGLVDQWRQELYRWAPELRLAVIRGPARDRAWQWRAEAHLTLVSYETFRSDFAAGPESPSRRRLWDVVVLDEAQRIKNREVEISRAVKQLRRRRSWALTGTPLENRLDDLASILEFVDQGDETSTRHYPPGPELLQRHRALQLRRRKLEVLDQLPPKRVINLSLPLAPGQVASYARAEQEAIVQLQARGEAVRVEHVLELILRLKQLCNRDPRTGQSAKLADIRERLEVLTAEGHRALLFSQFTDDAFGVAAVARALQPFRPLTYTGRLSSAEREQVIQRFKSNPTHQALVLSLRAGGVGLNLQEASYVFHIDRWWNPAVERQAEDRTHRLGQTVPVTVFKYTCQNTIEERIQEILTYKQQLFDEIVDDVSLDVAAHLSGEELFGLFGLPAPRDLAPTRPRLLVLPLETRVIRLLEPLGWSLQPLSARDAEGIDLRATRVDAVGLFRTLTLHCRPQPHPLDADQLRSLLSRPPDAPLPPPDVLVTPAGLTPDATTLAHSHGLRLWDEPALRTLESRA